MTAYNIVKVIQFALPVLWVLPCSESGSRSGRRARQGVGVGLAFGIVVAAAIFALYFGMLREYGDHGERQRPRFAASCSVLAWTACGSSSALARSTACSTALLEEYYWRWFVFGQLRRWTPLGVAVCISSLGFMAHHVLVLGKFFGFDNPVTYFFSACIAVGGAFGRGFTIARDRFWVRG